MPSSDISFRTSISNLIPLVNIEIMKRSTLNPALKLHRKQQGFQLVVSMCMHTTEFLLRKVCYSKLVMIVIVTDKITASFGASDRTLIYFW